MKFHEIAILLNFLSNKWGLRVTKRDVKILYLFIYLLFYFVIHPVKRNYKIKQL